MKHRREVFLYSAAAALVLLGAVFARLALRQEPQKPGPAHGRTVSAPPPSAPRPVMADTAPASRTAAAAAPNSPPLRSRRTGKLVLDPNARTALRDVGRDAEA